MESATSFGSAFRTEAAGRRTVALRDGSRVVLRPISAEDKPLLAASFERLGAESRYRRFFTTKSRLSESELEYLVDVDHHDHEAVVAIDRASGDLIGVARYIRSGDDPELAEVAVTVADEWQGRGLGRALLGRLTYLARRAGIRRFAALVQKDNVASLNLAADAGGHELRVGPGEVELVVELPPHRGVGGRVGRALREAATGKLVPAQTLVSRVTDGICKPPPS